MGGGSSKEIKETDIRNEINTTIKNSTTNINKSLSETVNESSTNMVMEVANDIQQSTSGSNLLNVRGDISAGGDSIIDINQTVSVDTINKAVIQIMSDQESLQKMATSMTDDISNKIKNDNALKADLAAVNAIKQTQSDAGGPEAMVREATNALKDMMGSLTGKETSKEMRTKISNKINMNIENNTINDTEIIKRVRNSVSNNVKNVTTSSCKMNTSGSNILNVGGSILSTGKGQVKISQSAVVKALNDCMVKSVVTNKLIDDITTVGVTKVSTDTSNTSKADSAMKADNSIVQIDEHKSAIMDFFSSLANLLPTLLIIAGVLVILGGGGFIAYKVLTKKDKNKDEDEDEDKDKDKNKDEDICEEEEKDEEGNCPNKKKLAKKSKSKNSVGEDGEDGEDSDEDNTSVKKRKQRGGNIINPQIQIYALVLSGLFYTLSKYKNKQYNKN